MTDREYQELTKIDRKLFDINSNLGSILNQLDRVNRNLEELIKRLPNQNNGLRE